MEGTFWEFTTFRLYKIFRLHSAAWILLVICAHTCDFFSTVKLGNKELFDKEQIGINEPFPVTHLPVYLMYSEQIGISEQFCDDQKVPY